MIQRHWTALHARLHQTLKQRQLLPQQQRVLLAVSGGQDSLCLLQLMHDLQPHWNWTLAIAHCNHRWRADADANAAYVEQLARSLPIPFFLAVASQQIASEAAAREWRYQELTRIAATQNYRYVVTGHTASDRAETLLYNLVRGSGADGLQALSWQRKLSDGLQLVRPLLEVTRTETAEFCQNAGLKVWLDATNQDLQYARNRIRQELIPYLQTHFNPQAEQTLSQTAELLRAEVELLESMTDQLWSQAVSIEAERIGLNRVRLRSEPLALQRRLVRRFLKFALAAPNFEQIEKVVVLLTAPNRSQTDPFPGGWLAQVQNDWIWLIAATRQQL